MYDSALQWALLTWQRAHRNSLNVLRSPMPDMMQPSAMAHTAAMRSTLIASIAKPANLRLDLCEHLAAAQRLEQQRLHRRARLLVGRACTRTDARSYTVGRRYRSNLFRTEPAGERCYRETSRHVMEEWPVGSAGNRQRTRVAEADG